MLLTYDIGQAYLHTRVRAPATGEQSKRLFSASAIVVPVVFTNCKTLRMIMGYFIRLCTANIRIFSSYLSFGFSLTPLLCLSGCMYVYICLYKISPFPYSQL
uniref:Uncharacterized protein n=1 Tax=Trypanosoma vivax (strain Y486) TaxID=1055687 RepID=G0U131_TRYVY|nr:hypothetical protein TVY486_0803940 [Trypanosoma vivax Y486]